MSATMIAPPPPSFAVPAKSAASAAVPRGFVPRSVPTFREAGLNPALVESLCLKFLLSNGNSSGGEISRALCLPNTAMIELLAQLKQQQVVTYVGSANAGDFTYALTDSGRDRARRFMRESMYVGPAPVSLEAYIESVKAQTITTQNPTKEDLRRAFSDLLINEQMFQILGPAINSGRGMFLYGPPGNGKSSIAERITKCFGDDIYIPQVLGVEGAIIKLFDAENHEAIETKSGSILKTDSCDPRWVKIKRPTIVVGGELTMDALEVQFNPITKVCSAPLQLKSNCGTFVIDDFGRQRMRPIEMLNRWIVPLEKRFDFLTLPNGKKVQVPFDQLIIFSTNLEPKELVDDAFLRRIPYKINVADPSEAEFRKLFELVAPQLGFSPAPGCLDYLLDTHYRNKRPFRACQPRDLLLQIRNLCLYTEAPLEITRKAIDFAASVYFTIM